MVHGPKVMGILLSSIIYHVCAFKALPVFVGMYVIFFLLFFIGLP